MELWIRSQDKTQLEIIVGVILVDNELRGFTNYNQNYFELGTYKTKERALEVLDEIHKCIVDKEVLDSCNNILTLANTNSLNEIKQILDRAEKIVVYEMPEK